MFRPIHWLQENFNIPTRIGFLCLVFLFSVLITDGTLLRLWRLHTADRQIEQELGEVHQSSLNLKKQIELSSHPAFVEQVARDHFDLVDKGEILFLFTE